MDVNKTDAVTPAGQSDPRKGDKRGVDDKQEKERDTDDKADESPWEGSEAFAVAGLLAGDLSPEIQKAFEGLARQIEPLRAEVERAKGREAHFKELAETHSFLPVPGRREFIRELTHITQNMEKLTSPSLALLHLVNADDVRRRFGRKALDAMLAHVCAAIETVLHPTDVVGSLGGNDFGVILLNADQEQAQTKVGKIVKAVRKQPFPWQGEAISLEAVAGVTGLESNSEPETAIGNADRDLISDLGAAPAPTKEDTDRE
jgi:diguanylate cyclase (GGDEF)-like protein